jgi:glycine cleavage system regulatory protein
MESSMSTLILTVMGEDRPGLVDALSGAIADHGGNWEQSRMAHLANKFTGILLVNIPQQQVASLQATLEAMHERGLQVTVEVGNPSSTTTHRRLSIELLGQDHPGIVHDISHALAKHDISIEELHTETRSASMAGGTLFHAHATLVAPQSLALIDLQSSLEELANELMVDIDLDEV